MQKVNRNRSQQSISIVQEKEKVNSNIFIDTENKSNRLIINNKIKNRCILSRDSIEEFTNFG